MGVMSCYRSECPNIMCNTYIDDIGYVCYECQSEFKEYLIGKNISVSTEGAIHREFKTFMETRKNDYSQGKEMNVDEFFKSYTRD